MKRYFVIAAAAALAACGKSDAGAAGTIAAAPMGAATAAGPAALKRPLPPGAIVLQRAVIPDPGVIGQGPAMYVMLPAGWAGRGGVEVYQQPCSEPFGVNWSASSPDGSSSVAIFPAEIWQWSNSGMASECKPGDYTSVRDYLAARAAQMFPGARVLDYRQRADFAKAAQQRAEIFNKSAAATGMTMLRAWADGGEVLFAFNRNGTEMRGVIGASAVFYGSENANPMGGEPMRSLTGGTVGTFGAIAPEGKLDFMMIEAVRKSVTPDPRWLEAYFDFQAKIGKINVQATEQRSAMIVAGGAEATRQNIATFKAMASASIQNSRDSIEAQSRRVPDNGGARELFPGDLSGDRMQRENVEAIRGVETYADPIAGGNVQLDATYDHAWRITNNDSYILTNDPNFNPGQYGIEATQMGVVK
ncbi:MAG: hypothetical protein U5J99_04090 [Parvularculaceae bacterium]|nr:hypothetical protein [Parvularculaceae bacterium]